MTADHRLPTAANPLPLLGGGLGYDLRSAVSRRQSP
jgi:hypothetical protein